MNRRQFHNSLFLGGLALMAGISSCSKDDPEVPEEEKTEEEKQAELKEELRTTMGFNSAYQSQLYYGGFTSANDFDRSLTSMNQDYNNTKYMAPFLVIDKQGKLWISISGTAFSYDEYTVAKDGDIFTITADYKHITTYSSNNTVSPPDSKNGYTLYATFDKSAGETLQIIQAYQDAVFIMAIANLWVKNNSITAPVGSPVLDTPSLIDF